LESNVFGPALLRNMAAAFDAVISRCAFASAGAREAIALRIIEAARAGEHDTERLALSAASYADVDPSPAEIVTAQFPVAHRYSA